MFVTHEKSPSKMKFQKPNILRRLGKTAANLDFPESTEAVISNHVYSSKSSDEKVLQHRCNKLAHCAKKPNQRIKLDTYVSEENEMKFNEAEDEDWADKRKIIRNISKVENNGFEKLPEWVIKDTKVQHNPINLKDCTVDLEGITLKEYAVLSKNDSKWCYLPVNKIENFSEQFSDVDHSESNLSKLPTVEENGLVSNDTVIILGTDGSLKQESFENCSPFVQLSYVCNTNDCKKEFPNEKKLKKHKSTHGKPTKASPRVVKQFIECPANKPSDSIKEPCNRVFTVREELLKHLKEDHTLDDAANRCASCSRGFFWASGVRAHGRACGGGAGREPLACGWPGCGRQFLQPCRLKEHARAHTGDKPYPCQFPNCGGSFRTASKLLRHARRHTGERRHRCEQCGRAFLRGEHLREHLARHARAPNVRRRAKGKANVLSLEQSSDIDHNQQASDEPMVHVQVMEADAEPIIPVTSTQTLATAVINPVLTKSELDWSDGEDLFTVCSEESLRPAVEGRAARTHCTWPLPRASPTPPLYVLERDVQVKMSDVPESKIYTIRSDLFLHGNIIHSEDSESGAGVVTSHAEPLDSLLDVHSPIGLMQEELLYADSAVDESSFQLLGDGDLQTFYPNVGGSSMRQNSV